VWWNRIQFIVAFIWRDFSTYLRSTESAPPV
jgi:hypothetical protein